MRLDHIAQDTTDLAATVAWYQDTFPQVEVLWQDDTWALLNVAGARIALVTPGQHPPHVGWRVEPAKLERLAVEHGVAIADHRDRSRSIYLTGPGGVTVEMVAYPDGSAGSAGRPQRS